MKISRHNLTQRCVTILITLLFLSFAVPASAQTNCSERKSGGIPFNFQGDWCQESAADSTGGNSNVTCRACLAEKPGVHPVSWAKGGNANCSVFSKVLVLDFATPVADVVWSVSGARTVTDNRGYTVTHNPELFPNGAPKSGFTAFFPGGGITQLVFSDPVHWDVKDANGNVIEPGRWEIRTGTGSYVEGNVYEACNCSRPAIPRPSPQWVISPDWDNNGVSDWRMDAEVSDNDGLVLRNVWLEGRYMAEKISVPYYKIATNDINPAQRGELKPNGTEGFLRSRLVDYHAWSDDDKLVVQAIYVITDMPAGSSNCLQVTQRYEFHKRKVGCEPLEELECSPWKPFVKYQLFGPAQIISFNVPQRFHFTVNGFQDNSVGLFRDCDSFLGCVWARGIVFKDKWNPLGGEYETRIITQGQDAGVWDNYHQTFKQDVHEPSTFPHFLTPGCPECMHFHWRWGERAGEAFGGGKPLLFGETNQDVDIGIARYEFGEDDPNDYRELIGPDSIRSMKYLNGDYRWPHYMPDEVIFWYSSTGHQAADTFFPRLGAFFSPSYVGDTAPITPATPPGAPLTTSSATGQTKTGASLLSSSQDHPESVKFDQIYVDGPTTYTVVDPSTPGPLPDGYVLYADNVYDISTTAKVSGSHLVTFSVPSIDDENVFSNLRVLQVEPESFDPSVGIIVDRTILSPDTPSPDFPNRRISARVNGLGVFILATLVQPPPPPNTDLANLAITLTDSPDSVAADTDLTYTVTITNNGPQTANGVRLRHTLDPETNYISATPSQGTCTESKGGVFCSLNSLASAGSATVTVVVRVDDTDSPIPPSGKKIHSLAIVASKERDIDLADNSIIEGTTVLPAANAAPAVSINSPVAGELMAGPANVSISMTASDSDGSISTVEVYENDNLIGTAALTGPNQYQLNWNNAPVGSHLLVALATDNAGRKKASTPVNIIVNGPVTIDITSPLNWTNFNKPASITVKANANLTGGSITKVDFYGDGFLLGTGTLTGPTEYSFTWNTVAGGKHLISCVATDNSGLTSTSKTVTVTVNDAPVINLTAPATGAFFTTSPATIPINAMARDDGNVNGVSFYANGNLIGSTSPAGVNQYSMTWNNVQPGTYSITAKATDNFNSTGTSAPVVVTVNAPPSVSITSPTNGTQFAAPANITLNATATDPDGSVAGVTFSANGISLGSATPLGGNQYSLTWSNVQQGSYAISATATDNLGVIKSVGGISISVNTPALLVVGSTTLTASDAFVKARLEGLNHTVTVKDGASATTADADGKALVVISSTVTPTSVGTKFRTVTVPVLTWESGLLNNMGMTGSTNKDFGTKSGQTQISITNPTHPLAAGVTGTATVVTSAKTFNWGKPNANAITIATISGDAAKTAIFGYEPGVAMPGLTAPARRLAIFLGDDSAEVLNNNGIFLLNAAIKWARGGGSISGSMVSSPAGSVDLTAAGIIDWAHWGRNGPTTFDHKAGITQKISNMTKIGSGGLSWFADCPTTFSWSDGTPTLNVSNTPTGINTNGAVGNGFEITVPADTTQRTLKLYVGVWFTQGKLEATLSDASAPAFVNSSLNNNTGSSFGLYTINYKAASAGQNLKIRFTIQTQYFSPNGNVALEAATLQ